MQKYSARSLKFYPIFLNLKRKNVLVVGGGRVAARKVRSLLESGARVTVIAPDAVKEIEKLTSSKKLIWKKRSFTMGDLRQKNLVICATDSQSLNRKISEECFRRRIWVNVVDAPKLCSFIAPAVVRRGEVTIAISTGGASPALAKLLRKKAEMLIPPKLATLSKKLKKIRPKLLEISLLKRRKILKKLLNPNFSIKKFPHGQSQRVLALLQ